jgi:hypothetical protein
MNKPKQVRAWVTGTDVHEWALKYLEGWSDRNPGQPSGKVLYDRLSRIGSLKGNKQDDLELLRSAKAAWASKKFREKVKPCNFALTEDTISQLKRLSGDYGETKTRTLEIIISDSLDRENQYKADKKDESIFKKRATIFERELNQALDELYEYELRLSQGGVNIASPLDNKQQKTVKRLSRARKSEIIRQLPALPPANTPKKVKKATTATKKTSTKCSQAVTPGVVSESPTINPNQIKEQQIDEVCDESIESQNDTPSNNLSNAASEASSDQTGAMTTPAIADTAQQPQQALAAGKAANDEVTVTPATTQAPSAHLNAHYDNDNAQQIPPDASSEIDPESANAQTTNLSVDITAHNPPEPPVTEQIDNDAVTGTSAPPHSMQDKPPGCEQLNEAENRHEFTDEDMAELKRLFHHSKP